MCSVLEKWAVCPVGKQSDRYENTRVIAGCRQGCEEERLVLNVLMGRGLTRSGRAFPGRLALSRGEGLPVWQCRRASWWRRRPCWAPVPWGGAGCSRIGDSPSLSAVGINGADCQFMVFVCFSIGVFVFFLFTYKNTSNICLSTYITSTGFHFTVNEEKSIYFFSPRSRQLVSRLERSSPTQSCLNIHL